MIIEFFGIYISKCPSIRAKKTPGPAHMMFSSLNRKQILLITDYFTPCRLNNKHKEFLRYTCSICFRQSNLTMIKVEKLYCCSLKTASIIFAWVMIVFQFLSWIQLNSLLCTDFRRRDSKFLPNIWIIYSWHSYMLQKLVGIIFRIWSWPYGP